MLFNVPPSQGRQPWTTTIASHFLVHAITTSAEGVVAVIVQSVVGQLVVGTATTSLRAVFTTTISMVCGFDSILC